ncbi:MAG: hypothetical protein GY716_16695, partial [bacterium]|nr:hypothetical protein [bacterium]
VLGAIHLYVIAMRRRDGLLAAGSFLVFATAFLAHYLAVVYAVFFAAHYGYVARRERSWWRPIWSGFVACNLLAGHWLMYNVVVLGLKETLTSNTTMIAARSMVEEGKTTHSMGWGRAFVGNLITTTLPYTWRFSMEGLGEAIPVVQRDPRMPQEYRPDDSQLNRNTERLSALAANPNSLFGGLGYAGCLALLWMGVMRLRGPPAQAGADSGSCGPTWRFWLLFSALGIPLNILCSFEYFPNGVAHLNLQPYVCLAVVWIVRSVSCAPLVVRVSLATVFLFESVRTTKALVVLQQRRPPISLGPEGDLVIGGRIDCDMICVNNWIYKLTEGAVFLADRLGDLALPAAIVTLLPAIGLLAILALQRRSGPHDGIRRTD